MLPTLIVPVVVNVLLLSLNSIVVAVMFPDIVVSSASVSVFTEGVILCTVQGVMCMMECDYDTPVLYHPGSAQYEWGTRQYLHYVHYVLRQ